MQIISHRGNLKGPTEDENKQTYIEHAIEAGFAVEIDVWYFNGVFWLGHNGPTDFVPANWLEQYSEHLLIHVKNIDALQLLRDLEVFFHVSDPIVCTTKNRFVCMHYCAWPDHDAIVMKPECISHNLILDNPPSAICTDYPKHWRGII